MRINAEAAYVLHARPWRETSLLVEVLAQHHGRLGLVARGVQGPKKQVLRAALQPLQHIRLEAVQRGELAQLVSAEALDAAPRLAGEAMLAAFYVNELVMRLAPRQDPHGDLYRIYGQTRSRLASQDSLAWTLRRFERDLLESLGSGFDLSEDAESVAIDPAARYRIDPEQGPRRLLSDRGRDERSNAATGSALLALAADRQCARAKAHRVRAHHGAEPRQRWPGQRGGRRAGSAVGKGRGRFLSRLQPFFAGEHR
jgi:DNA repair protein RecO (recombination protein O)